MSLQHSEQRHDRDVGKIRWYNKGYKDDKRVDTDLKMWMWIYSMGIIFRTNDRENDAFWIIL